jgi:predicted DNA-binding transcriptional regulator YafY
MDIRKWEVRQRLAFIESRLFWERRINRSEIAKKFDISVIQASADIARYQEVAPGNVIYNNQRKCYMPTPEFSPVLLSPIAEDHLYELFREAQDDEHPIASIVEEPQRRIVPLVLQQILRIIRDDLDVQVRYQSMSQPQPVWRWVTPHAFLSDSHRWHVRAYCHIDGQFKDFLLARVLELGQERERTVTAAADVRWNTYIDVYLKPNPNLTNDQKSVIENDYGMTDGTRKFNIREASLFYFIKNIGVDSLSENAPIEQQVVLANSEELSHVLPKTFNKTS